MAVVPPASVVRLASAIPPPTAPPKVVAPVLFAVSAPGPSTVPVKVVSLKPKLMVVAPPTVVVPAARKPASLYVPESVVLSLNVVAPVVVTPTDEDVPPPSVVSELKAVVPPTMLLKVVAPVEFTARLCAPATVPSTAPVNVTAPVPVDTVTELPSVVVPVTLKALFVVV